MQIRESREKLLDAAFMEVYKNGYHGASIASILKNAGVPKGSMYHFFNSKKDLVLTAVEERIFPKMDVFFDFTVNEDKNIFQTIECIFERMSEHPFLIKNGCPIHRLIVEMAPLDNDFEDKLNKKFNNFVQNLSNLFEIFIDKNELKKFDTYTMARFFITSTWGEISLPPSISSKKSFLQQVKYLITLLKSYES
jgi:TetR/AcrR family transcriptional repressor of nem operon